MTDTSLETQVPGGVTTITMWAYPMDNGVLLSELGQSIPNTGWNDAQLEMVDVAGTPTLRFGMWNGAGIIYFSSDTPTPLNSWYHIAMKYTGTQLRCYVNGFFIGKVNFKREGPVQNGQGLHYAIAASDATNMGDGTYANMKLGEFQVYNRSLKDSEILSNFYATRGKYGV